MGLETVKEEIISNARNQERALLADARKEASEIIKKAEIRLEEIEEQSNVDAKRMIEAIRKQELASAELENKKAILEAKKQLIDAVFDDAGKKIEKLDSGKREYYLKKLLEKAKNDIEVATIYCNKKDIKLIENFNDEESDIIGGLIAENEDKTVRVDYSFGTILENIKENELQNINKILFG